MFAFLPLLWIPLSAPASAQDTDAAPVSDEAGDTDAQDIPATEFSFDEQPEDASFGDFDLDSVFVAPVRAQDSDRLTDARSMTAAIIDRLRPDHMLLLPEDVENFGRDRDLSARDYLLSCPVDRYVDCGFVVALRGGADRAVVAEWTLDGQIELSFLDVDQALVRLVLAVDPTTTDVPEQVHGLLGGLLDGSDDLVDVRIEPDASVDPDAFSADALRAAREELDSMEQDLLDRGDRKRGRAKKLTRADLEPYRGRDVQAPWEAAGLTADSWRRYKNSGRTLGWWKARAQGRQWELALSVTPITLGTGPWVQRYEAWYSIDPVSLQREDTYVMQDQERGLLRAWEFGLAIGFLPWMDAQVYGGPVINTFRWRIQRIVPGDEQDIDPLQDRPVTTWRLGGRLNLAPFPTWPARPTLGLGATAWWGQDRANVLEVPADIPDLPPNRMVLLGIHPGVEADLGPILRVWARFDLEIPVSARVTQTFLSGGANLPDDRPGVDAEDDGLSFGGAVGLTARIRMAGRKWRAVSNR